MLSPEKARSILFEFPQYRPEVIALDDEKIEYHLTRPDGVAFQDGTMYLGVTEKTFRFVLSLNFEKLMHHPHNEPGIKEYYEPK